MMVDATSAQYPDELGIWKSYQGDWWGAVRLVGWITQNADSLQTKLYYKWQVGAFNYWPYWNDAHTYTVSIDGVSKSDSFKLPQPTNDWRDVTGAQVIALTHDQNGEYSGTMRVSGYKCWESFSSDISIEFPSITIPSSPEPEPEPVVPEDEPIIPIPQYIVSDNRYVVYANGVVLYHPDDPLRVILDPKLDLKLNETDGFEFTITPDNDLYSRLSKLGTTIEVHQGPDTLFRGRILDDDIDFYNNKSIHCEGVLAFLGDTIMNPYNSDTYKNVQGLFKAAIDSHYSQVPDYLPYRRLKYKKCDVSKDIDTEETEYSYTSDVLRKCLDEAGGYIKLEYNQNGYTEISYLASGDHTNSQKIEFAQNLLDISQHIDASEVYTSVLVLGKKDDNTGVRLKIDDNNPYIEDQDAIKMFGRIIRHFEYDDVEDRTELRTLGLLLLNMGLMSSVTISIKAVDLHLLNPSIEKIRIGDYVRIISTPHGIDAFFQCCEIVIDMQNPENTVYTFGSTAKYLTDKVSKM